MVKSLKKRRLFGFLSLLSLIILIPFLLFYDRIEAYSLNLLNLIYVIGMVLFLVFIPLYTVTLTIPAKLKIKKPKTKVNPLFDLFIIYLILTIGLISILIYAGIYPLISIATIPIWIMLIAAIISAYQFFLRKKK